MATIEREVGDLRIAIDPSLCVAFVEPQRVVRERLIAACEACPVDALLVWDATGNQLVPATPRGG